MTTAVIHKYVHRPDYYEVPYTVDMPANANVFVTRVFKGDVTSWALIVGEPKEMVARKFLLCLTGKPFNLPDTAQFMDTIILRSNTVGHLFWIADPILVTPVPGSDVESLRSAR